MGRQTPVYDFHRQHIMRLADSAITTIALLLHLRFMWYVGCTENYLYC
jgi:hypothetical protein